MRRLLSVACALLLAAAVTVQAVTPPQCMPNAARRDCGYWDANSCQQNNCCWTPVQSLATAHLTEAQLANPPMHMLEAGTPWCYTPQSLVGGYVVTSAAALRPSASQRPGWAMQLKLADGDGYFGTDAPQLIVRVVFETKQRLRVHISDPTEARWEIPESLLPLAPGDASVMKMEDTHYAFSYTSSPFGFAVTRRDDGEVLFNTTSPLGPDGQTPLFSGLVFSDQFLSLSTSLPANPVVYGLGEKVTSLQLQTSGKPVTFWARDAATPVDQNIYGSHPFYMEHRRTVSTEHERANGIKSTFTTKTHGVWLRNSNGMDVLIHDAQSAVRKWQENNPSRHLSDVEAASYNKGYLTYRVIGGVLDFFIYAGSTATSTSTAAAIVQQYQVSVGLPHMPPYWSLGFHQCRWGYANLQEVKDMVKGYANTDLPLDTAWTDIDYMGQLENFSTDPVNYPTSELAAFIKQLRSQGQRYVLIIDPAIHNRTGYDTYESGLQQDVYVKRASGETFIGKVWPGFTAFPSFFPPQTAKWWGDHIAKFRAAVPVDGLWIDMNEASNFCSGDCDSPSERLSPGVAEQSPREQRMLAAKAETIAASKKKSRRSSHTVALASVSASELSSAPAPKGFPRRLPKSLCTGEVGAPVGTCLPNNPPYRINNAGNGANLNSLTIDMDAVHAWGSNKLLEYDVHNLYGFTESIVTNAVMESQMGTRSLLVSRSTFSGSGHHAAHWLGDNWSTWASMAESIPGMLAMQFFGIPLVGADICGFNGDTTEELCARWQALGAFYPFARNHNAKGQISQEPFLWQSVADVTRKTLSVRYSLLHVFNTLLFETHKQGGTVVRPLFLNFAQDPATFAVDAQFMIGSAVLVTPVLTQGATSVTGYFPQVNDAGLPQRWFDLWSGAEFFAGSTGLAQLDAPLSTIPLHYAGGNVIPTQAPGLNTEAQAKNPFNIVVAPDSVGAATGALFLDDGETLQVGSNSTQATFRYANGQLTYALSVNIFAGAAALRAQQVTVLGVAQAPKSATINGKPAAPQTLQYSSQTKVLMLNTLNLLPLNQPFTVAFTF